jgi:cellulose synthase/poly-beta-1,6-N-acetylglucosamine synthase-like glycosyltransferase
MNNPGGKAPVKSHRSIHPHTEGDITPDGRIKTVPVVSILLPCFNAAETLNETLESVARQTASDFEVVAVDDGSTDSTLGILQSWAERDPRFCVLSIPHGGVITAANTGIKACNARYIARLDADDIAHPDRLAMQVNYLDDHPNVTVVSSFVRAFPEPTVREGYQIYVQWLNSLVTNEDIRREMFVESPLANPSVMIRRNWLEKMGGYQDYGWPEDYDLWLRMYLAGAVFAKIPKVLLSWRDHPTRITRTDSRYSIENFLRAKAHYLARGPLADRDGVIIWGAGMMGRRLGKQLQHQDVPLCAFVDIDPKKIGRTRRGKPVIATGDLKDWWQRYENPAILASVGARKARGIIRDRLNRDGYREGEDWWATA